MNTTLERIKRLLHLSELGLLYAQNEYDKERYEEMKQLNLELLEEVSGKPLEVLKDFHLPAKDYSTPKVDVRGLLLNEKNEILLVKEMDDGKWALPGGWGEVGFTPSEVVCKEIEEETGLTASVIRLLAVYDKKSHPHPPQPFYVYKLVFLCRYEYGELQKGFDVEDAQFFDVAALPEISEDRILKQQITNLFERVMNNDREVYFD